MLAPMGQAPPTPGRALIVVLVLGLVIGLGVGALAWSAASGS
jgi:hypothetical protein